LGVFQGGKPLGYPALCPSREAIREEFVDPVSMFNPGFRVKPRPWIYKFFTNSTSGLSSRAVQSVLSLSYFTYSSKTSYDHINMGLCLGDKYYIPVRIKKSEGFTLFGKKSKNLHTSIRILKK
jgi:hypothetical protein